MNDWHLLDIACRFHQSLLGILSCIILNISNLRGKTLKMQGTLGDCISYVEKPGILELWYKKLNNEETSYWGK